MHRGAKYCTRHVRIMASGQWDTVGEEAVQGSLLSSGMCGCGRGRDNQQRLIFGMFALGLFPSRLVEIYKFKVYNVKLLSI